MSKRIIVVEDDVLIGLDIIEQLALAGFDAVGPFVSVADALAELDANGCDMALLDVNLRRETSEAFADELKSRNIPFIVLSGFSSHQHPNGLMGALSVTKPVHMPELFRVISGLG